MSSKLKTIQWVGCGNRMAFSVLGEEQVRDHLLMGVLMGSAHSRHQGLFSIMKGQGAKVQRGSQPLFQLPLK